MDWNLTQHMNYISGDDFVPLLWHLKEKLYIGNIGQSDALTLFLILLFLFVFSLLHVFLLFACICAFCLWVLVLS